MRKQRAEEKEKQHKHTHQTTYSSTTYDDDAKQSKADVHLLLTGSTPIGC